MDNKQAPSRPKIGVTGPDSGGGAAWFFTALQVRMAGGIPIRIRPSKPKSIERLQGLIIGGGADVDPETYEKENVLQTYLNQTLKNKRRPLLVRIKRFFTFLLYPVIFFIRVWFSKKGHGLDRDRDILEFTMLDHAIKREIPVLGICRGSQLINIYFKGTLYRDINTLYDEEPNRASIFPVKRVAIKPESKLAQILQTTRARVNALHNQAVQKPGQGIDIVAKEPNQIVQAIESVTEKFVIGVQWHPEYLIQKRIHRRIFKALVKAAQEHAFEKLKTVNN
ncbi:gamma-glutamyl-gamma-aminobutyrate hydrolase family protein [Rhodocytophaga rosea]|uniref:Gamma-glutamyl-gamma-aminobutyrate hydrolase family protein n=1 Tax=Rhodocytophaga rosea TaxID=2704465 RepID=A0A6C0GN03_9BACT|nr:gamma-glutamyl-gamma-aminobutyrate hydrolase family protein [Rhodocytophaga rosea]QHT69405.1 gamma-glutamyl-gamma-aminobutyrate hydrolase family protein [Rhodocytophaga rosea]